jgi:ATP-dependent exoDNAse (exonuclease V) beta subunit
MKLAVHPSGAQIEFADETHTYICGDTILTSTTTVIHDLFPKFDAAAVALKKGLKDGVDPNQLLSKWQTIGAEASSWGNLIHSMAEQLILGADRSIATSDREGRYFDMLSLAVGKLRDQFDIVEIEKIVFSPNRKLAGTIDLLLRSKQTGRYIVADWKTSREIKKSGFQGQRGFGVCSHLEHCNFIHYSLQLSIYRELLLSEGYLEPNSQVSTAIIHLYEDENGNPRFSEIKPVDLSREASLILAGL